MVFYQPLLHNEPSPPSIPDATSAQILIIGLGVLCVSRACFNALTGMGADYQGQIGRNNNSNTAIYASMTVFSLLGGGIINLFGVRIPLCASGLMYALHTGAYINANHHESSATGFLIASAVLMGIGAGILWSGQGMIMVSYPRDHERGRFIAIFWIIFNLGGMLGAVILFATSFTPTGNMNKISDTAYIVLIIIQCVGSIVALTLVPPMWVVRDDGTFVAGIQTTSSVKELLEIVSHVFETHGF